MEAKIKSIDVPIFKPDIDQFADFHTLIRKIESDERSIAAGLAKVSLAQCSINATTCHSSLKLLDIID